jgi:formylmethanofuran dehydrogenase subunit B
MHDQIAVLHQLVAHRERSTRLVLNARASDERHRIQAERYLRSLDAFRAILRGHEDETAPQEVPEVVAVARALGADVTAPTA